MRHILHKGTALLILLPVIAILVSACSEVYKDNPLGYNFLLRMGEPGEQKIEIPTSSQAKKLDKVRDVGLGTTIDTFAKKYGKPISYSQPPTIYAFAASPDKFPSGSVVIVSFDRGAVDDEPRAVQISFVAGIKHPTSYAQAQAIADGFFPLDASQPKSVHSQNDGDKTCLSKTYESEALGKAFAPQNFTDAKGGIAKPGSITISFFPKTELYEYNHQEDLRGLGNENIVSSLLITLGTKPYC